MRKIHMMDFLTVTGFYFVYNRMMEQKMEVLPLTEGVTMTVDYICSALGS
jgi:hypothetical protein